MTREGLVEGAQAPDFELTGASGARVRLSRELDRNHVILLFYPIDFGIMCTLEMKKFKNMYEWLSQRNIEVVGISTDSPRTHRSWKSKLGLPFPLLSDQEGKVSAEYGVLREDNLLKTISNRAVFIIDRKGMIRYCWVAPEKAHNPDMDELKRKVEEIFG